MTSSNGKAMAVDIATLVTEIPASAKKAIVADEKEMREGRPTTWEQVEADGQEWMRTASPLIAAIRMRLSSTRHASLSWTMRSNDWLTGVARYNKDARGGWASLATTFELTCESGGTHAFLLNCAEEAVSDDGSLLYHDACEQGACPLNRSDFAEFLADAEKAARESNPWTFVKAKRSLSNGEVDWLIPGILERGKLMALFGPPKTGKSLFVLETALNLVKDGKSVVYFDEENAPEDVFERALDMGHDLSTSAYRGLQFVSFSSLNVDDEDDAEKILRKCEGADLVVFDSFAKFFRHGSQNDDAAINRAYRLVLKPLRAKGVSVIRLDHTGHGEAKRPAGSVQKLADVDHNWLIKAEDAPGRAARRITLIHTENRTGRGEDVIVMERLLSPLRHTVKGAEVAVEDIEAAEVEDAKVAAVVDALDTLGVPLDWSITRAMEALRGAGKSARKGTVTDAVRIRRTTQS